MICNTNQILDLISAGVIENAQPEAVNATSLDLHIGDKILVETISEETRFTGMPKIISLKNKDKLCLTEFSLEKHGSFILRPGQFILAQTQEIFHLPMNISAEYKLKSSMARIGLEHLNAGWSEAGWNGSVLTLELRNLTTYHDIEICFGDRIGQIIFYKHDPVDYDQSYAAKGRYNGCTETSAPVKDEEIAK